MSERLIMRRGFTLIELLVCVAIIAILAALIAPLIFGGGIGATDPVSGNSYYNTHNVGVYQCVSTYVKNKGDSSSKRVNLLPENGGPVVTMTCDDDMFHGSNNSATIYAQFIPNEYYTVTSVGFRKEGWNGYFPNITAVTKVPR